MSNGSSGNVPSGEQEAGKFIISPSETIIDRGSPLPDVYGENRLVAMVRDPLWFFVYWEITPERLDGVKQQYGRSVIESAETIIRVYDVTGATQDDWSGLPAFDVKVAFYERRWYIQVPQPGRSYAADLGFKFSDGQFLSLMRSNRILLPLGRISDELDSQWMAVGLQEEWDRVVTAGAEHIGQGSAESSKGMAQRWEFLKSVFSSASSRLSYPSSGALPGSGSLPASRNGHEKKP